MTTTRQARHSLNDFLTQCTTIVDISTPHSFEPFLGPRYNFNEHSLRTFSSTEIQNSSLSFRHFSLQQATSLLFVFVKSCPWKVSQESNVNTPSPTRHWTSSRFHKIARCRIQYGAIKERFPFLIMIPHPHIDFSFFCFLPHFLIVLEVRLD